MNMETYFELLLIENHAVTLNDRENNDYVWRYDRVLCK